MFHCPSLNLKLCPLPEFVKKGVKVRYRSMSYEDFLKQNFAAKLDGRERLERLKLEYYLLDQPAVRLSHAHDVPEYMLMDELDIHLRAILGEGECSSSNFEDLVHISSSNSKS